MPRARIVDALVAEQEEGLVLAVVDFRDANRTADGTAPAVEQEVRTRRAGLVQEEIVGPETGALEGVVDAAVEVVGAALDADVGDAALGLAELGVEGVGLDLELLHDVGGRHVGGGDFEGIGGGGGRRAVNRDVVQVALGAAHREVDDVGGFERTVQADAAVERHAGGQADQQERIAVGERQIRDAFGIDHGAQGGGFGVEQRSLRAHRHRLLRGADFQRDADVQAVGHADFDAREWIS